MKNKWIIVSVFSTLCMVVSCSKNGSDTPGTPDTPGGPKVDSSKCLLTDVKYGALPNDAPYYSDDISFTYDSLNRVKQKSYLYAYILYSYEPGKVTTRAYINSIIDSNITSKVIYTLDNNGRIVSHIEYIYFHAKSESDIYERKRMEYTYDTEGYLTGMKEYSVYTTDEILYQDLKLTYQNGNLVLREVSHYDQNFANNTKLGTDSTTYTYDNTTWYPEATYLYEVNDYRNFKTDKPNKNNVTNVQCKLYKVGSAQKYYKTIHYTYSLKGPKLDKVTMDATTNVGVINSSFSFGYKCN